MPQRERTGRVRLSALALELLVVFVGVYAAFALAAWDRQRQDDVKRRQLTRALVAEVRGTTNIARIGAANLDTLIAHFESARVRGEHPRPPALLAITHADPNIWNATVAAGGIDLIDVPTFVQLSRFYNAVQGGLDSYQQMRRLSESQLIPHAGDPIDTIYVPGTNDLQPMYAWYPELLAQLRAVADIVIARGDSVLTRIAVP
jgi:hypothetical protein